ncbi:aromatic acid exporter family protein [Streptomyces sp. NPDC000983]|uniref:aromatic acid exporter family protein n=1 Tax=Streptomyces sp. NPDC000983 TaxID=3154373 RepID=UPI00331B5E08
MNGAVRHRIRRAWDLAVMRAFREAVSAVGRHARAAGLSVRRAWVEPGRERDVAVQAAKAALAAGVAWAVVGWWLHAPMAFMAPWAAIVLVESTVYRSLAHGLQQLAAIAAGTVVATACAMVLDSTLVAMALVLPVAVLLGNYRRLGNQGIYAATAGRPVRADQWPCGSGRGGRPYRRGGVRRGGGDRGERADPAAALLA